MIVSLFADVSLLFDGIKMVAGDPKFGVRFGSGSRHSDCCGRTAYTAQSVRQKNMVREMGEASSRCQDGKPFARGRKATSVSSRGLNCRDCAYQSRPPYKRRNTISSLEIRIEGFRLLLH